MTEAADPLNPVPDAPESPVEPLVPEVPPTPPTPPEPAPEPVIEAPEVEAPKPVIEAPAAEAPEPAAGDQELEFDAADVEFAGDPSEHPSKLPVAHRPAPAGPSSLPHPRVARAREENR